MPFKVMDVLTDQQMDDYFSDRQVFYDDFVGSVLGDAWSERGTDEGSAVVGPNSIVTLQTGPGTNDDYRLNFNGVNSFPVSVKSKMIVRAEVPTTNVKIELGFAIANLIYFILDTSIDNNWHAKSFDGSAADVDTGVAAAAGLNEFIIEVISANEVKFYINGALVATITANIPTDNLEPHLRVRTLTTAQKSLIIDYVYIRSNKRS